ncbi:helix-turn-helix domain-containing protein [Streptomyces sp. ICC1]|uniref:helix-turn-helix domain-containing protein n=1 Tax=Streptomyces sp. ICC1 TaxID=2099583 RepID=UPI001EF8DCF9|nr:helix-turn-helix domain-containing protein [Streptomyces sp. ICC1]
MVVHLPDAPALGEAKSPGALLERARQGRESISQRMPGGWICLQPVVLPVWPPLAAEPAPEHVPEHVPEPPAAPAPAQEPPSEPEPEPADGPPPVRETPAPAELSPLPAPEEVIPSRRAAAKALLGRLRRIDQRLLLGARDIDRLAGAVEAWLERGASLEAVTVALTAGLPERPRNPAGLVAYRLTHQLPPVAEPIPREFTHARPHPIQTCDTCDKTFRAPRPDDDCPWCVARAAA